VGGDGLREGAPVRGRMSDAVAWHSVRCYDRHRRDAAAGRSQHNNQISVAGARSAGRTVARFQSGRRHGRMDRNWARCRPSCRTSRSGLIRIFIFFFFFFFFLFFVFFYFFILRHTQCGHLGHSNGRGRMAASHRQSGLAVDGSLSLDPTKPAARPYSGSASPKTANQQLIERAAAVRRPGCSLHNGGARWSALGQNSALPARAVG